MNEFTVRLDLAKGKARQQQTVFVRQGDKSGTTIRATITDHGAAAATSGLTARFQMRLPNGTEYYRKAASLSGNTATVTIDETQAASVAGRTDTAYFQLLQGSTVVASTESFTVVVLPDALADAEVAESYDSAIQDAIDALDAAVEQMPDMVEDVLADHPEWTTTVQDGSITKDKLATDLARDRERLMYRLDNMLTAALPEGDVATASDAAKTPMAGLTLYGKSTQDGTPAPSAPVAIQSVEAANLLPRQCSTQTVNGVTFTVNADGSVHAQGTASENAVFYYTPDTTVIGSLPVGTMTLSGCPAGGGASTWKLDFRYQTTDSPSGGSFVTDYGSGATFTRTQVTYINITRIVVYGGVTINATFRPQINLGSTAYPYVPYGNVGLWAWGFNQWDERWELGNLNTSTGAPVSANNMIRSVGYIPVLPSSEYYGAVHGSDSNPDLIKCFYDAGGTFISSQTGHGAFTTPAGASLMRFRMQSVYGTTYHHDICINISGPRNGEYAPYTYTVTPIHLDGHTLRSLPDGTRDEVRVDERGHAVLVQRVGSVEITAFDGTNASGGRPYGYKAINGKSANTTGNKLLCDKLTTTNGSSYYIVNNPANVVVWGLSGQAQTDLGPAVLPLTVQYPLATPVTIDLGYVAAVPLVGPDLTAQAVPTAPFALTYERDLNATLARLESAIATLA